MKQTFSNIDLSSDKECDYSLLGADEENKKAIRECEKDELLLELEKICRTMPEGELRGKYKKFISEKEKLYQDWNDCIVTSYEELDSVGFWGHNFNDYYFDFTYNYDYDEIHDYFVENGAYLFVNPEAYYDSGDNKILDECGNIHKTMYFRFIGIDEYFDLDERLLVVYADYFIKKYGFSSWYYKLTKEQLDYVKKNVDKISLTKNQRAILLGTIEGFGFPYNERYIERVYELETSDELLSREDFSSRNRFIGRFMKRMSDFDYSRIDVAKLSKGAFRYLVNNFWGSFPSIEKKCEARLIAEILINDNFFRENKLTGTLTWVFGSQHIDEDYETWDLDEIKRITKTLRPGMVHYQQRLNILRSFLSFKKWFEDNKVGQYIDSERRISGSHWTVEDAYRVVKNPNDPRLWIESHSSRLARVV